MARNWTLRAANRRQGQVVGEDAAAGIPPEATPPGAAGFAAAKRGLQACRRGGETTFEDLPAGKYAIRVFSPAKPYSVVRASSEGVEISGHDLNVTPGASLNLAVFLVDGVVTVEGFAKRGDKPVAGVMVALVPKDPESHLEMFRRDQSDLDGSFVLRGVIPGSYTIFAVEDAWGFNGCSPACLSATLGMGRTLRLESS